MFPRGGGSAGGGAPVDLGIDGVGLATRVGSGGFGVVYRARQEAFDRTVAVKVLSIPSRDDEARRRFARECRSMGSLSGHPNIVAVYGSGETSMGHPYILMDHLAGGSLGDLIEREGRLPPPEVAEIGVKLASALVAAHAAGVLHRDVKPDNVLVSNYAEPQLADFGVARIQGGTETRTGVITGSLAHAAPEVLSGRPATEASDVYSLASTLYALAAGNPPFVKEGDETFHPLFGRIMSEDPPDLRQRGLPSPLWGVIADGLAKDPSDRTPTARAFGEALRDAQEATGLQPTALVAGPDIPVPLSAFRIPPAALDRPSGRPSRHRPIPVRDPSPELEPPGDDEGETIARPAWRLGDGKPGSRVSLAGGLAALGDPLRTPGDGQSGDADDPGTGRRQGWAAGGDEGVTYRRDRPWSPTPSPSPSLSLSPSPPASGPRASPEPPLPAPGSRRDLAAHPLRLAAVASAVVVVVAAAAFAFIASRGDPSTDTIADDVAAPSTTAFEPVPPTTPSVGESTTVAPPSTRASPGTTEPRAPTPPGGGGGPATTPTTPRPAPTTETIEVEVPPGQEVGRCWVFRGTANLRPDRALVVGVRDQSSPARTYFQRVVSWSGPVGQGGFSRPQLFGTDDSLVGHRFTVSFVVVDMAALDAAHGSAGAWEAAGPPPGGSTLTTAEVVRVPGAGSC